MITKFKVVGRNSLLRLWVQVGYLYDTIDTPRLVGGVEVVRVRLVRRPPREDNAGQHNGWMIFVVLFLTCWSRSHLLEISYIL